MEVRAHEQAHADYNKDPRMPMDHAAQQPRREVGEPSGSLLDLIV